MLIKRGYFVILLLLVMPLVVADAGYFYFNNAAGQRCYDSPPIMPGANKLNIFPFPCLAGCFGVEGQTYVYYCTDLGSCAPAWVAAYYVNWDGDQRSCECHGKTWFTDSSKYFLGLNPNCCGDDTSPPEYYMTRGIGAPACMRCPVAFSSTSCVSNSLNCRNEYSTEVTCYDNLDNDCDGLTDCKDTANCVS